MRSRRTLALSVLLLSFGAYLAPSCGENTPLPYEGDEPGAAGYANGGNESPPAGGGTGLGGTGGSGGTQNPPPEKEVENRFQAPVATGHYVWSANPASGRVALIDATKFSVRTATAGLAPTYIAPVPSSDKTERAVVLDPVLQQAALLEASSTGELRTASFRVGPYANSWTVSSQGHWAIAWSNYQLISGKVDPLEGYQDITVIDLQAKPPKATTLAVGFRPRAVTVVEKVSRAFVVTEDGISVVDLTDPPHATKLHPLKMPDSGAPVMSDVTVTEDGHYALVRYGRPPTQGVDAGGGNDGGQEAGPPDAGKDAQAEAGLDAGVDGAQDGAVEGGPDAMIDSGSDAASDATFDSDSDASSDTGADGSDGASGKGGGEPEPTYLAVIDLQTGQAVRVPLPGVCTDLDLSADGKLAIAVVRETNQVALIPIPGVVSDPSNVELLESKHATVGSVAIAEQAPLGLFYSNAVVENRLTYLWFDQNPRELRTTKLYSSVLAAFPAPSGKLAIVVHQNQLGFSAQNLRPLLPAKIVATKATIQSVALNRKGDRALVVEDKPVGGDAGAYLVRAESLQVDRYRLASPPLAGGMVEQARKAFIAQEHPEGRITFIDLETGKARTLTGFEMGAQVVDGSHP